jgi:sulfur carrier protein
LDNANVGSLVTHTKTLWEVALILAASHFFTGVTLMVKINSLSVDAHGLSVRAYIDSAGYNVDRIAVEINGNIIPKNKYETTLIADGDEIEIVHFVGGG